MSDHSAIYCIYQSALRSQASFVTYRDMKHFCANRFRCDLHKVPWMVCEVFDDVDDQYHTWYTLFMEVANHHAPLKTRKCRKRMVPWMTPEIRELMRQRDKTHRIAVKERSEQHFQLYKSMRNHVNCELRRARKEYFQHLLLKESRTPQTFWKNVKVLMPSKCHAPPSSLQLSGRPCSDPVTLANAFNDYFVNIGPTLNNSRDSFMDTSVDIQANGQKHTLIAPDQAHLLQKLSTILY